MERIINSLLETDAYKFSMGQAIYHQFSDYKTTWSFKCRNTDVRFTAAMIEEIREQIRMYCELHFTEDELAYLENIKWIKGSYVDFLRLWHPRFEDFVIEASDEEPCGLHIETKGTWLNTSMYEIPTLAIVNEVYFRMAYDYEELKRSFEEKLEEKIGWLLDGTYALGNFSEFGLRRRLSAETQELAVRRLAENFSSASGKQVEKGENLPFASKQTATEAAGSSSSVPGKQAGSGEDLPSASKQTAAAETSSSAQEKATEAHEDACPVSRFVGTSNVYLAKKWNLTPVGTMAHEWIMCVGQGNHKHNPAYSNWYALDAWVKEYGVLNGTALTDAITTDCFLKDFQLTYSTLFSGVRHDSGDPFAWGDKMIRHYEELGIDPKTKTLLFSDSLDFKRADALRRYFEGKSKVAFGIGTYISNDTSVPALNIVMKTTLCNGMDVAKISDTEGKGMCKNPAYVHYLKRCIDWRMNND